MSSHYRYEDPMFRTKKLTFLYNYLLSIPLNIENLTERILVRKAVERLEYKCKVHCGMI